jgi:hypothetical protein
MEVVRLDEYLRIIKILNKKVAYVTLHEETKDGHIKVIEGEKVFKLFKRKRKVNE